MCFDVGALHCPASRHARWAGRAGAALNRCLSAPQASRTEDASPGQHGVWLVRYEIGGQELTNYWFYVDRRWVFDLVLSNPDAVRLYRMSPQRYVAAVGCAH